MFFFSIVCRLSYEKGQEKNYQGNTGLGKRQITAGEKKIKISKFPVDFVPFRGT